MAPGAWLTGRGSPKHSDEGSVDGVPVVDVQVVPAALGGKVVEAQPEDGVGAGGEQENRGLQPGRDGRPQATELRQLPALALGCLFCSVW